MKDYIITAITVLIMVSIILVCHNYTRNTGSSRTVETVNSQTEDFINTAPDNYNNYNNYSPAVTTASQTTHNDSYKVFQTTATETTVPAPDYYNEDEGEYEISSVSGDEYNTETVTTTVTTFKSILENATAVNTTVQKFNILPNPEQTTQEVVPMNPNDFSLIIN